MWPRKDLNSNLSNENHPIPKKSESIGSSSASEEELSQESEPLLIRKIEKVDSYTENNTFNCSSTDNKSNNAIDGYECEISCSSIKTDGSSTEIAHQGFVPKYEIVAVKAEKRDYIETISVIIYRVKNEVQTNYCIGWRCDASRVRVVKSCVIP